MNNKIANICIVVKDYSQIATINDILHQYSENILSRSGMPYKEKNVRFINIMIETSPENILDINEKLSSLKGVKSQIMTFEI